MKKVILLILPAIALSIIFARSFNNGATSKEVDKENFVEELIEPNELMLLQRSYPDVKFDLVAYQKAAKRAYNSYNSNQKDGESLSWEVEGPGNIGGRFNCIEVDPTNSNIIYAGAASGGVFKTINGGTTWNPIFDEQPFLAIGCMAIDPNDPNTIWVGTGDSNISGFCYVGDGIYRSTDGGTTWTNMGLNDQYVLSKIIIDPTNSNIIYAASMGQPFIRDNNRGLFKSIDGGDTWNSILFVSNQAGVIDLVINPDVPDVLYAASYDRIRNNQESLAHGSNSKIWKTTNGGDDWTVLTNGLPNFPVSRIGLTISPTDPNILYTIIADSAYFVQGIYKTIDDGESWNALNTTSLDVSCYSGYGWYFGKIYVNPTNSNQIYVLGVDTYTTSDNGNSWSLAMPPWYFYEVHADQHDMSFIDGNTILLCTDGGIYKTINNCVTWTDIDNIPVNQVYHANENPHSPNDYWCGVQDNGTTNGNSLNINNWNRIYGGDGFQSWIDPIDQNIFYVETQNGGISYTDDGGFTFYGGTFGIDPIDTKNWDMPYIISKADHTVLYSGTNRVYKMEGAPYGTWISISDDLTDGLDEYRAALHTITSVNESPINPDVLYAGTADANVWASTNAGSTWINVTGTLPERYVTSVKSSPNLVENVYVTHSGYRDGENIPHVHQSSDYGATWNNISGDLPEVAVNDILIKDGDEQVLFVSTDVGVYYSINGGTNWMRLGDNMPFMPVFDIEFNITNDKVIASTFARSVQTIDISGILSVGIRESNANENIQIFPNPASGFLKIHLNGSSDLNYSIYNLEGKLIQQKLLINHSVYAIPILDLSKGSYVIEIKTSGRKTIHHFIKI